MMSLFAQQIQTLAASQRGNKPAYVESIASERSRKIGEANRNAIRDVLTKAGEPMRTRDIADATGINWEIVRKWCVKMAADGQLVRCGEYGSTCYARRAGRDAD
jgi:hypothetical protein